MTLESQNLKQRCMSPNSFDAPYPKTLRNGRDHSSRLSFELRCREPQLVLKALRHVTQMRLLHSPGQPLTTSANVMSQLLSFCSSVSYASRPSTSSSSSDDAKAQKCLGFNRIFSQNLQSHLCISFYCYCYTSYNSFRRFLAPKKESKVNLKLRSCRRRSTLSASSALLNSPGE